MTLLLVFLGGGAGAVVRYLLSLWIGSPKLDGGQFPWATFTANSLACLVLALGLAYGLRQPLSREAQLVVLTGFCGGFSTFSTFAAELFGLLQSGHAGVALLYLLGSVAVGVAVLYLVVSVASPR